MYLNPRQEQLKRIVRGSVAPIRIALIAFTFNSQERSNLSKGPKHQQCYLPNAITQPTKSIKRQEKLSSVKPRSDPQLKWRTPSTISCLAIMKRSTILWSYPTSDSYWVMRRVSLTETKLLFPTQSLTSMIRIRNSLMMKKRTAIVRIIRRKPKSIKWPKKLSIRQFS